MRKLQLAQGFAHDAAEWGTFVRIELEELLRLARTNGAASPSGAKTRGQHRGPHGERALPKEPRTVPLPYSSKRYAAMSADSYMATPLFGSTKYGNIARPPSAFTLLRNRVPPLGHGYTIGSRLSADNASRAIRQYGQTSNS